MHHTAYEGMEKYARILVKNTLEDGYIKKGQRKPPPKINKQRRATEDGRRR